MAVEIDLIVTFGRYCGMNEAEMTIYRQHALNFVEEVMRQNFKSTKESLPDLRALMQSIGTTKYNGIAANDTEYVAAPSSFIGFREDSSGTIWLRFDDAYNLVEKFYQRQNEQFLTTAKTIKENTDAIFLRKSWARNPYQQPLLPRFEDVLRAAYYAPRFVAQIYSSKFFATVHSDYVGIYDNVFATVDDAKFWLNERFILPMFAMSAYVSELIEYIKNLPLNNAVPVRYRQWWEQNLPAVNNMPFS